GKSSALVSRRGHERRRRSKPHGQRTAQSGSAPPHGAQRHAQGGEQDILTRKIQKSRLESGLSRQTPRALLKCNCPACSIIHCMGCLLWRLLQNPMKAASGFFSSG